MNYTIHDSDTRVRNYIDRKIEAHDAAGIQYIVVSADTTIFGYSGGWADVEAKMPLRPNTTMMIYSMSKTMTATAVLQLIEQGKIALDDTVTKYLGDIPYGSQVTIRHLLSQTSGIPNPIPLKWVHLVEEHSTFNEKAALRKLLTENSELDFQPGKKYAYSNISYWLLGEIIEKVSGVTYQDFVRQNVFQKLNLPESEADFIIPSPDNHSKGYLPKWSFLNLFKSFVIDSEFVGKYENGWLHIKNHYLNGPSFGGIVSSTYSVSVFLQDQLRDHSLLFTKETKNLFFEQQKNNDGEFVEMTLGWHVGTTGNVKYYFKEGGGGGFHSEMRIYPTHGIASVVIANNTSFDARGFLNTVDKEFFP